VKVQAVSCEDEFWSAIRRSTAVFEEQGDKHGRIDGELQNAIEEVLVPVAGSWEGSERWFHNQDFYGDGVRALIFRIGDFPWRSLGTLQALLVDEAAEFAITIQLCDALYGENARTIGGLAILRDRLVATNSILELLRAHLDVEV
jgi:hypothetical protein